MATTLLVDDHQAATWMKLRPGGILRYGRCFVLPFLACLIAAGLIFIASTPAHAQAPAPNGSISGMVLAAGSGKPVGGSVCANDAGSGDFATCVPVNADGAYLISVPQGDYLVHVEPPDGYAKQVWNHTFDWGSFTPVVVLSTGMTPNVNFDLVPGGTISGQVNADGTFTGVPNLWVTAEHPDGTGGWHAFTDDTGNFTVTGLEPGQYRVWANVDMAYTPPFLLHQMFPAWVTVHANQDTFAGWLNLLPGGTIRGRAAAPDGSAVPGTQISFEPVSGGSPDGHVTINPDGTFEITGLVAGDYRVTASAPGFARTYAGETGGTIYADQAAAFHAAPYDLIPGAEIALIPGGSIIGIVTDQSTGLPVGGGSICVDDPAIGRNVTCQPVNADGNYEVTGVPTGVYHVHIEPPTGYAKQVWDHTYDWGAYTPVHVYAPNPTYGISFSLVPGGTISGRVTDSQGQPVAGADLNAIFSSGAGWSTQSGPDGSYTITGLEEGDYSVFARAPGFVQTFYPAATSLDLGTNVHVTPLSDTPGVDIQLVSGADLTLQFLDGSTGHPIQQPINVHIWNWDTGQILDERTVSNGFYETGMDEPEQLSGSLPAVKVKIQVEGALGFADQYYLGADTPDQAAWLQLTPGVRSGAIFSMVPQAYLTGQVTEAETGDPIPNLMVWAGQTVGDSFQASACTDADGRYAIRGLPVGTAFRLHAGLTTCDGAPADYPGSFWPDRPDLASAVPIRASGTGDAGTYNFALQTGAWVEGNVFDAPGVVHQGQLYIGAVWAANGGSESGIRTANGQFRMAVQPGTHKFWVCGISCGKAFPDLYYDQVGSDENAEAITVDRHDDRKNVDFYLSGQAPAGDQVQVTPRPGVGVTLYQATGGFVYAAPASDPTDLPPNFMTAGNAVDLFTSGGFTRAQVCLAYDPATLTPYEARSLYMAHLENGIYVNITDPGYPDLIHHVVCGTASHFSTFALLYNHDQTPPTLAPALNPASPILLHAAATINPNASDSGGSGLANASCDPVDTSSVGPKNLTCTASDNAGNTTTVAVAYQVIYRFDGFLQPVNDVGRPTCPDCAMSVFRSNSTVPVKFQLMDAYGNLVQPASPPRWVAPMQGGSASIPIDEAVYTDPATTGAFYTLDGDHYAYNWKTKGVASGYYWRIGVVLDDGQTYFVTIGLR